jgi:hypothetical protein
VRFFLMIGPLPEHDEIGPSGRGLAWSSFHCPFSPTRGSRGWGNCRVFGLQSQNLLDNGAITAKDRLTQDGFLLEVGSTNCEWKGSFERSWLACGRIWRVSTKSSGYKACRSVKVSGTFRGWLVVFVALETARGVVEHARCIEKVRAIPFFSENFYGLSLKSNPMSKEYL